MSKHKRFTLSPTAPRKRTTAPRKLADKGGDNIESRRVPDPVAAPAKTPTGEFIRALAAHGCPVELIAELVEIGEHELARRRAAGRKRVFSAAVQDLFDGDGMVDVDPAERGFDGLRKVFRRWLDRLSPGDESKARRLLLAALPKEDRQIFEALLKRPKRGQPKRKQAHPWAVVYTWRKAEDQTLTRWKFARELHESGLGKSVESNHKRLKGYLQN